MTCNWNLDNLIEAIEAYCQQYGYFYTDYGQVSYICPDWCEQVEAQNWAFTAEE